MANYDLLEYIRIFLKKKLHSRFNVDDVRGECILAILSQENLNQQLRRYFETNEVPTGKDLSLLKAVLYRQRLKFIEKETRHPIARLHFITHEESNNG
jgi:hypothetical protein